MKILLSLLITIFAFGAMSIKKLRVHKWKIMGCYFAGIIVLFVFYNYRTLDFMLPFYHPTNQMFYQSDFINTGEYPDALLPYLLDGRTVYISEAITWNDEDKEIYDFWGSGQMSCMNIVNILEHSGATVEKIKSYLIIRGDQKQKFEFIGYINDTFRYSHFYNDIVSEYGNGFYYYWFYAASMNPTGLYICQEDIEDADELCLLMDENANIYIASKSYADKEGLSISYAEYN